MVAHRVAAQRVALTRAYHSLGKLLLFVRLAILMSSLPLLLQLSADEYKEIMKYVDVLYPSPAAH